MVAVKKRGAIEVVDEDEEKEKSGPLIPTYIPFLCVAFLYSAQLTP